MEVKKMFAEQIKPTRIPEITIKHDVYRKINAYADLCNNEISALGSVRAVDNKILIDDVFLFEQNVSMSSTELSPDAVSKFICDYVRQGKDPSMLKFWWHSHVNMEVFWSGTDMGTIDKFTSDWMISMVSNKRKEFKVRLDKYKPFRMYIDDLPLIIEYDKSFNTVIKEEIDAKVKSYYIIPPDVFPRPTSYQGELNKAPSGVISTRTIPGSYPVKSFDKPLDQPVVESPVLSDPYPKVPSKDPSQFKKPVVEPVSPKGFAPLRILYRVLNFMYDVFVILISAVVHIIIEIIKIVAYLIALPFIAMGIIFDIVYNVIANRIIRKKVK